jgi:hypothetical protein
MDPLEQVWTYREDTLYPRLFGSPSRGLFPLEHDMFTQSFGQQEVDPRWLFLGVFEFKPTATRDSWLYVTSGASTPWETVPEQYQPDEYSWLGVEFVIELPEQADWPIHALRRLLGYHVLASHDRLGSATPLDYGHRIPAGGAIDGSGHSALTIFAVTKPFHYEATAQLDSGRFDFLHIVGITEQERDYAKANGTDELVAALRRHGAYPVTVPGRASIPL